MLIKKHIVAIRYFQNKSARLCHHQGFRPEEQDFLSRLLHLAANRLVKNVGSTGSPVQALVETDRSSLQSCGVSGSGGDPWFVDVPPHRATPAA